MRMGNHIGPGVSLRASIDENVSDRPHMDISTSLTAAGSFDVLIDIPNRQGTTAQAAEM
jgi:hypothetical protein